MITSSAIELVEESLPVAVIEEPSAYDPNEQKFFDAASELETQVGNSFGRDQKQRVTSAPLLSDADASAPAVNSSLLDDEALVLAGVTPRHRVLPWLLFALSIGGGVAAWFEVVKPRFERLRVAEGELTAAANEVKDATAKVTDLEKKISVLVAEQQKLGVEAGEEKKARDELAERLRTAFVNEKRIEVVVVDDAVTLRMTTDDVFLFGDVRLKDASLIDQIGVILKGQGTERLTIRAHTDATPVPSRLRSRFRSNYELSAARAFTVLHRLEAQKVTDQVEVISAAATYPIASNKTKAGRRMNRRVEIVIR